MVAELNPRWTFDTFVVGPGNRLASAAARRAADSPAASYNPLFLYSASGLGKSHILTAMTHHSERLNPDCRVLYQTLERYLHELAGATQAGSRDSLRERYRDLDILLLDDVQFLTGQADAQELLLRTLDTLNASGSQIVLASDRPPAEIDGLDARLLSRFSGGLMVDIAPPEFDTRLAILRRKAEERGSTLPPDVGEALARLPFRNVRELQGGLNRMLALQDLEGRKIKPEDVASLVEIGSEPSRPAHSGAVAPARKVAGGGVDEPIWRRLVKDALASAENDGFATGRLRRVLDAETEPGDPKGLVDQFNQVLEELRHIRSELDVVGNPWPEAARGVLKDPDRLEEARALLASARERVRDFPPFPIHKQLDAVRDTFPKLAVRAAEQMVGDEAPEYNPLYAWSPDGWGARGLLEAAGATFLKGRPGARAAMISAREFADEFSAALAEGVAGAWRERWWTVDLLLVHQLQELAEAERAQDEFFHLFEAVKRRGARIILAADRPASQITGVDDRIRSRFEGGLVVEVDVRGVPPTPVERLLTRSSPNRETFDTGLASLDSADPRDTGASPLQAGIDALPKDGRNSLDADFLAGLAALEAGTGDPLLFPDPMEQEGVTPLTDLNIDAGAFPTILAEGRRGPWTPTAPAHTVEVADSSTTPVKPAEAHPASSAGNAGTPALTPSNGNGSAQLPPTKHAIGGGSLAVRASGRVAASSSFDAPVSPPGPPTTTPAPLARGGPGGVPASNKATAWIPSPEKVIWEWPQLTDRLVLEAD